MLIFEPDAPRLHWTWLGQDAAEGQFEFAAESSLPLVLADIIDRADAIGYVLHHGADMVHQPVSALSPASLKDLEPCVRFWPEANHLTMEVARLMMARRPAAAHVLFCDTAFFASLPPVARTYAVPDELRNQGVRRYGGDGLCHQWVGQQVAAGLVPAAARVVSVHLGDSPSVAALRAGQPVECSQGFSPLEGLPSAHGCGDVDPAIVLFLRSTGRSVSELTQVLTQASGFQALLGHPGGLTDVLQEDSPAAAAARAVLRLALVKAIGAHLAALGGADMLAFACDDQPACHAFVMELCGELDFLGLDVSGVAGDRQHAAARPAIKVVELPYPRAVSLAALAATR
jgi:acetate kinase